MKKSHVGKIIALLALLFISSSGNISEVLLQQGVPYETGLVYGLLLALVSTSLTSVIMMAVPFICRWERMEKLECKSGKRLCMWNSVILFVLSMMLLVFTEVGFIGGTGAVIFYFINKWLFVEDGQLSTKSDKPVRPVVLSPQTTKSKESLAGNVSECQSSAKPATRYCSLCGKLIDPKSKKCSGCGKQYFKGISLKTVLVIWFVCAFILSITLNVVLLIRLQDVLF